ncbi:MAG: hypothetical protein U0R49_06495 [Fimbriimonadales bacterium]
MEGDDPTPKIDLPERGSLPEPPEWDYERPAHLKKEKEQRDKDNMRGLGVGLASAYTLVGCMGIGWGIGWVVDRSTGGDVGQPIGATAGALLGMVSTIILLNRSGSRK